MARRVSRPLALRVTWLILPLGISAHAVTLTAWGVGLAAAAAFAWGNVAGWLLAACLLQLWYLFDHVDGQLARYRATASLDGAALDYLMHHTVNLLVPVGIGWGLAACHLEPLWLAGGLIWGVAQLSLGLSNDVRYKAFIQRLKRVHGELRVVGGGGGRPVAPASPPRHLLLAAAWAARKACEPHVLLNVLTLLATCQWMLGDGGLLAARIHLAAMVLASTCVAAWTILRSVQSAAAEHEFTAWYRPREGGSLIFEAGWWYVENRGHEESRGEKASPIAPTVRTS
jgi:hypothetical protein